MTAKRRGVVTKHIVQMWPMSAPPRSITDIVAELAMTELMLAQDEADEFAAAESARILKALIAEVDEANAEARVCRIALNSSSSTLLQGSGFSEADASEEEQVARRRRAQHDPMLEFLRSLTWVEFEQCCRGVLDELGCVNPSVTSASNDQGIDFFGSLPLKGRLKNKSFLPGIDANLNVWMVGQAKHYGKTKVSTPDLRELVGSVQLARAKAFADGGVALRDLDMRTCDPVFYLFFTTGTISKDGMTLLRASGMVSMDGSQLAAFLADNGVGERDDEFNEADARTWLSQYAPKTSK